MKLDCILTSCNLIELYIDFIPIFIKSWNKLIPEADIKIILISDYIPEKFMEYKNNIILFSPINDISTSFISQYIRLLYPSILEYKNGIIITDIDMIPMSRKYYINNIKNIDNNKFLYYRNDVISYTNQIAMCYNIAIPNTWKNIFKIYNKQDIIDRIIEVNNKIKYNDNDKDMETGWYTDQLDLYKYVMEWNKKTNNFIYLNDKDTGYNRLDRDRFELNDEIKNNIINGNYTDYHAYRPYNKYKKINDEIVNLLYDYNKIEEKYNIISFCLYGNEEKYCRVLIENLKIISSELINFETWIYIGNNVPSEYIDIYKKYNTKLIYINKNNDLLKYYRFFPIDNPEVKILFSRDTDSIINERDLFCIRQFINSDKKAHIIRDNVHHKTKKICAGLFGLKQNLINFNIENEYNKSNKEVKYGSDEIFLENILYDKIKDNLLIHSDIIHFSDEDYPNPILIENNGNNFIGNVCEYKDNKIIYKFNYFTQLNNNIIEHLYFHVKHKSWIMIINIFNIINLKEFTSNIIYNILTNVYMAYYYTNNINKCVNILKLFKFTHIDELIINNSNYIINKLNKKIIGTTDINRIPNDNEIVIIYGNFHHSINNLPISNIIKRHAIYYKDIEHDIFEYDECWESISNIYILNLIDRVDRYMEILVELTRINAPLDRIYHYKAKKEKITGNRLVDPHLGACKNHIDVVKDFINKDNEHCIIFEDDVTFTSDINLHKKDMKKFFDKQYNYDICLITSSKYDKIKEYDELLSLSYQICTTTSGYILSKNGAKKILPIFEEGYDNMKITKDTTTYAVDRYWSKIQKDDKFFLFNNKFGYQRCNYSSITNKTECHFD